MVAAAIALIDELGVEALTMRALADSMGISPMTLYRHVADKHTLLTLIPDVLLAEVARTVLRKRSALSALRAVAEGLTVVLLEHNGAAKLFEQPAAGPNMTAAAEHVIALLVAEGLPANASRVALRSVVAQVIGEVLTVHDSVDLGGVDLLLDGIRMRLELRPQH